MSLQIQHETTGKLKCSNNQEPHKGLDGKIEQRTNLDKNNIGYLLTEFLELDVVKKIKQKGQNQYHTNQQHGLSRSTATECRYSTIHPATYQRCNGLTWATPSTVKGETGNPM